MRETLAKWRLEPIVVPRWALMLMYAGFVVLGVVASVSGIPTLDLTTPTGYTTPYGVAVALSAVVTLIGATRDQRRNVELAGALLLSSLLTVYWVSATMITLLGDPRRAGLAVLICMVSGAPTGRSMSLLLVRVREWTARKNASRLGVPRA